MNSMQLTGLLYLLIVIGLANIAGTIILGVMLIYQMRRRKPND